jgi:hypothetical protein
MSYKVTVLRARRHREFLADQRQDPVTRRVFVAGDRVTLCATCLLTFLEESWEAAGGTHCGQSATTGLKAFDGAAGTPEVESGVEPGDTAPEASTGLRPVPVKLLEVPVRLRG